MTDIRVLKEKVKHLKIMFVDDEDHIRNWMGIFLKKFFDDVFICKDGLEGLSTFRSNQDISIIISDILMPKLNGLAMIEEIKKLNPDVFVILISAFRDELEKDYNVDLNMHKPISYEDMHLILKKVVEKNEK